jgi:hypothetical protein
VGTLWDWGHCGPGHCGSGDIVGGGHSGLNTAKKMAISKYKIINGKLKFIKNNYKKFVK